MSLDLVLFIILQSLVILVSILKRKLTTGGTIMATLMGIMIYAGFGIKGIMITGSFFVIGNLVTSWKKRSKIKFGLAENEHGERTMGQVFANGGAAAILALAAILFPSSEEILFVAMGAAFSSATADTVSSELGTVYGKEFFNILSFKKDQRGENGVISLEGTIAGMVGSLIIATVFSLYEGFNINFVIIFIAGTSGNIVDSLLGATVERQGWLGNNSVNFFNTISAAIIAYMLA